MRVFWLAFLGKLSATIFIAVCVALGFGPDQWVKWVIPETSSEFALLVARIVFLLVAAVAISLWVWFAFFRKPPKTAEEPATAWTDNPSATPLRSLRNSALRQRAMSLAAEMRAFEAHFRAAERVRLHEGFARRTTERKQQTEEQRNAAWHADLLRDEQQRTQFHTEFMTRFYQIAVPMRHELCARLGIFPPYSQHGQHSVALDHGMLAGVNPVTEAADLLDSLSGKLP